MATTNEKKPMNTKQRKCMTEWQQETGTVTERDEYLFEQGLWTDVTAIVGPERKTFECHGLYLAKCSAVFAAMLYTEEGMKTEIILPDISARTFSLVLKYVYNPERGVDLQDSADASALLKAAQKYELHSALTEMCEALLYSDEVSVIEPPPKKKKISWQQQCHLMLDRDKHLLQEKIWTDCSFNIADSQVFHCHKVMLAKTSPAFAAMLFGELWRSGGEIDMPDISVSCFSHFLKYAYTGSLGVDLAEFVNSGDVWDVLCLADRYLLPERLSNQLRAWVFSQIYTDNFWDVLREAETSNEQTIINSCLQILQQFTGFCLGVPSFLTAPHRLLQKLVECNFLSCTELELFDACVRWAKHLLAASGVEETGENLRQTLGTILARLRLKALSAVEFIRGPSATGLFTQAECYQILRTICDPQKESLPSNFCSLPARGTKSEAIYFHACPPADFPHSSFQHQNTYSALCSYEKLQEIQCCLMGFQILTQDLPADKMELPASERTYDEHLSILVFQRDPFKIICQYPVSFNVKYGTMLNFSLPKYVNTCLHSAVNLRVVVLPHKSGLYQVTTVPLLKRIYETFMNLASEKVYQMQGRGFVHGVVYSPRTKDRPCIKHAIYPEQPSTSRPYGRRYNPTYGPYSMWIEDERDREIDEFYDRGGNDCVYLNYFSINQLYTDDYESGDD